MIDGADGAADWRTSGQMDKAPRPMAIRLTAAMTASRRDSRPTVRARPIIAAALNPAHAVANDTSGAPPNRANAASGPSVWP